MNNLRIRFEIFLVVVLLLIGCIPVVNAENASSRTNNLTNLTLKTPQFILQNRLLLSIKKGPFRRGFFYNSWNHKFAEI